MLHGMEFLFQEAQDGRLMWGIFQRLVAVVCLIQYAHHLHQILPWCGSKGVYPAAVDYRRRRTLFPGWRHVIYWPAQMYWSIVPLTDLTLLGTVWLGVIGSIWLLVTGHLGGLLLILLTFLALGEMSSWRFPWHCALGELLWLLIVDALRAIAVGSTDSFSLLDSTSLNALYAPPAVTVHALRVLSFRILIGFGKTKFIGSTLNDVMYVKSFLVVIPIPTPVGLWMYKTLPRIFFLASYGIFFLTEVVIPFGFFAPAPWRPVAGVFFIALMGGIQLTGNFGYFNFLSACLALTLWLPATSSAPTWGGWWYRALSSSAGAMELLVLLHMVFGVPLLLFNSWASASWFAWPSLRRLSKPITTFYELLQGWRVLNSYGIFFPAVFPPVRQMPVFEISDDGKKWEELKYKHQSTGPEQNSSFALLIHPLLDFTMFYQLGYNGFTSSTIDCRTAMRSNLGLPIQAIARNIIEHGSVLRLFANGSARQRSGPPKFVRVNQVTMVPGSETMWKRLAGVTVELPAVTVADLDNATLLPSPFNETLDDSDPSFMLWRQRSPPYQTQLQNALQALLSTGSAFAATERDTLTRLQKCKSVAEVAALHDSITASFEPSRWNQLRRAVNRGAYAVLNDVEGILYNNHLKPFPTHFTLYLASLSAASGQLSLGAPTDSTSQRAAAVARAVEGENPEAVAQGWLVFIFLFAPTLRRELSIIRRMKSLKMFPSLADEGLRAVLPGISGPLEDPRCPLHQLPPTNWGETLHQCQFNSRTKEYELL